jgi:hypothetical protein
MQLNDTLKDKINTEDNWDSFDTLDPMNMIESTGRIPLHASVAVDFLTDTETTQVRELAVEYQLLIESILGERDIQYVTDVFVPEADSNSDIVEITASVDYTEDMDKQDAHYIMGIIQAIEQLFIKQYQALIHE